MCVWLTRLPPQLLTVKHRQVRRSNVVVLGSLLCLEALVPHNQFCVVAFVLGHDTALNVCGLVTDVQAQHAAEWAVLVHQILRHA